MRVLVLPSFYCYAARPWQGVFVKDQARSLCEAGISVDVLVNEDRSWREFSLKALAENHWQLKCEIEDGTYTMRRCGWNPGMAWGWGGRLWVETTTKLFKKYLAQRGRPDLIHAHVTWWAGYAALRIHNRYDIPYVLTEHSGSLIGGNPPSPFHRVLSEVAQNASSCIAVSTALAAAIRLHVRREVSVVPNVVDTEFFHPSYSVQSDSRKFVYLAIGSLVKSKGLHILLRAFASRYLKSDEVKLQIGGEGPERLHLERLAAELGISSKVEFLGGLSRDKVRAAMQDADALVFPSFYETFGVVLIEAMSVGIPVIAARCGGPEDVVGAETGIFVNPGSVDELAEALGQIRERKWDRKLIRSLAVSRFSPGRIATALIDVYRGAIEQN